jgi:methyltransferase (TIGR00027 family)
MSQPAAIRSAETMAFLRAVVAREESLVVRCEDAFASLFLGGKRRLVNAIGMQGVIRWLLHLAAPGSYGFAVTRTRHFDEVLLHESSAGIEQLVLLGAGYDSRPYRFRAALAKVKIFEIDHPGTQARKRRILQRSGNSTPTNLTYIPVDFNRQSLQHALAEHGFSLQKRTLFLWEGVSYYLPQQVVEEVLDFVGRCAPESSIVFDYALSRFVKGDTSTYGGKQIARWLEKIGEPFLFGLDPEETATFLSKRGLAVLSDLGASQLEQSYLKTKEGCLLGKTLGHVRMVHAATVDRSCRDIRDDEACVMKKQRPHLVPEISIQ